jgi:hypothetical protein
MKALADLLVHAGLLSPGPLVGSCQEYLATSLAADDGTAMQPLSWPNNRCTGSSHRSS